MRRTAGCSHPVVRARQATRRRLEGHDDGGFTLIELLIVVTILPIVVGALAFALVSVLGLQKQTSDRIGDSNDELVASSAFNKDVQSAQQIQTVTAPACGATGQQLVGLQWGQNTTTATYETVVSYVKVTTGTTNSLYRNLCTSGASSIPTSSRLLARDVGNPTIALNPTAFSFKTNQGWTTTQGLFGVTLSVSAPGSGFTYALSGLPSAGASNGAAAQGSPNQNLPGCNLANPGPAVYSSVLCFVDFSSFASTFTHPSATCTPMSFSIANSSDILSFCLSVTPNNNFSGGVTVEPQSIPTYDDVTQGGNSQPYLGNNGFYQGVLGDPAISQRPQPFNGCGGGGGNPPCTFAGANAALTTLTFTNITVTSANNAPATGWNLVTGDAESTDGGEWNVYTNTTSPAINWNVLPNSSTSLYGNSCYNTANPSNNGLFVYNGAIPPTDTTVGNPSTTGFSSHDTPLTVTASAPPVVYPTNATSVGCEGKDQLDKTGTLMLEAPEPNGVSTPQSLSITMQGGGYQAIFIGVLL
jgi:prepilin-type N-terminal cleavage/methylation domain-containing protein